MALLPSQLLHANVAEDETACPICFGTMLQPRYGGWLSAYFTGQLLASDCRPAAIDA